MTFRTDHPALYSLAECLCTYDLTDGFCRPDDDGVCRCWKKAQQMLDVTGLSSQACQWVFKHRRQIEQEAKK